MTFVSDDLNRADDPTGLGSGWLIRSGAMGLANGMAYPVGTAQWAYATPNVVMATNDAEVSVTLGPADGAIDHFLLFVGANATGECVFAYFYQGNAYFWHQYSWSSYFNIMGASYLPQAPGDTITLRRNGTVHTIHKNGAYTGISINYATIPIDSNHLLLGFGLYSESQPRYRTIDSFSAKDTAVDANLVGVGQLSSTVTAVAAPTGWTPLDLPGLAAWIDPAQDSFSDNEAILNYTSHDPSGKVFHSFESYEPHFKTAAVDGKPRIEFVSTGSAGDLLRYDSWNPGTAGLTYVFVAQMTPAQYGMMITYNGNSRSYELRNSDWSYGVQIVGDYAWGGPATSSTTQRVAGVDSILMMSVDTAATTLKLYIDDALEFSVGAVSSMPNVASNLSIGERTDGYYWSGLVAEVLVLDGPISDANRAKLVTYLQVKHFGLAPPVEPTPVSTGFTGSGQLIAPLYPKSLVSGDLGGSGQLTTPVFPKLPVITNPSGTGQLSAGIVKKQSVDLTLFGTGAFSAANVARYVKSVGLAGNGQFSPAIVKKQPLGLNFGSTGQLSATVTPFGYEEPVDDGGWHSYPISRPTPKTGPGWWPTNPGVQQYRTQPSWFALLERHANLVGAGNLASVIAPRRGSVAALCGSGSLSPQILIRNNRSADFSGNGLSNALMYQTLTRTVDFSGSGGFEINALNDGLSGVARPGFAVRFSGGSELAGGIVGSERVYPDGLSADIVARYFIPTPFASTGELIIYFAYTQQIIANLISSGTLTANVKQLYPLLVQLSGAGELTETYLQIYKYTVNLLGTGQISAAAFAKYLSSLGLDGAGALTSVIMQSYQQIGATGSVGTVTALISQRYTLFPNFSGSGALEIFMGSGISVYPEFTGDGQLGAAVFASYKIAVNLLGAGQLSAIVAHLRAFEASGSGTLTAAAFAKYLQTLDLSGSGTLNASLLATYKQFADMIGEGKLFAPSFARYLQSVGVSGAGAFVASILASYAVPAGTGGTGSISVTIAPKYAVSVDFSGVGSLSATGYDIQNLDGLTATVVKVTGGAPFAPTSLTGLTVWLDASQLTQADGVSIGSSWNDLSGGGHHGTVVGSPAPVVKTNALNGKRVVRFTVNEGRVRGNEMYPAATPNSSFTVIFVGRQWGPYIGRIFSNPYPPFNFLVGTHVSGINSCFDAGWVNSGTGWPTPPTPWTIWGFVYHGSPNLGTFFVNGIGSGSSAGGGAHDDRWNLSGYSDTGVEETCDVEVAELITYNRDLSDTERGQVETYLTAKWGL